MKGLTFVSALLGVAAGLLFGMLLRDQPGDHLAPAVNAPAMAELLDELRGIRVLLEQSARTAPANSPTQTPAAVPVPLAAPELADPVAELKAALQAAVNELRSVAAADTGLMAIEVDPQAAANRTALMESTPIGSENEVPALFGLSRREVYRRYGPPDVCYGPNFRWVYEVVPGSGGTLVITFDNDFVVWVWRGDGY